LGLLKNKRFQAETRTSNSLLEQMLLSFIFQIKSVSLSIPFMVNGIKKDSTNSELEAKEVYLFLLNRYMGRGMN